MVQILLPLPKRTIRKGCPLFCASCYHIPCLNSLLPVYGAEPCVCSNIPDMFLYDDRPGLFLSVIFSHHLRENPFHDHGVERTDYQEICDSQSIVEFYER